MQTIANEILKQTLRDFHFTNDENEIETCAKKLETFSNEIILFNKAYNLVNTSDKNEIFVRHIFDSLAGAKTIKAYAEKICEKNGLPASNIVIGDIGSGAGFPGIPLATCFQQFQFVLVERMDKRCAFLENCVSLLDLKNVRVKKSELEKCSDAIFHITTFRAFRELDEHFARELLRVTKNAGILCAYKAKAKKITDEMKTLQNIFPFYKIEKLTVPFLDDAERNLVMIENSNL